jgi:hypothetical protein
MAVTWRNVGGAPQKSPRVVPVLRSRSVRLWPGLKHSPSSRNLTCPMRCTRRLAPTSLRPRPLGAPTRPHVCAHRRPAEADVRADRGAGPAPLVQGDDLLILAAAPLAAGSGGRRGLSWPFEVSVRRFGLFPCTDALNDQHSYPPAPLDAPLALHLMAATPTTAVTAKVRPNTGRFRKGGRELTVSP